MSKRILIIEDDRDLSDSLHDILTLDHQEVLVANSGREGLRLALETHPELIILDIKMPDMNGYEVFEKLRADDWGKTVKILVLTASESLENIAKNIDLPIEQVLFKPEVSVQELRAVITSKLTD